VREKIRLHLPLQRGDLLFKVTMTAAIARTTAAEAAVTRAGCASWGARSAAQIMVVLPATWRR
jgi:hypothetical protein